MFVLVIVIAIGIAVIVFQLGALRVLLLEQVRLLAKLSDQGDDLASQLRPLTDKASRQELMTEWQR